MYIELASVKFFWGVHTKFTLWRIRVVGCAGAP
jgi:hypothetical protein